MTENTSSAVQAPDPSEPTDDQIQETVEALLDGKLDRPGPAANPEKLVD